MQTFSRKFKKKINISLRNSYISLNGKIALSEHLSCLKSLILLLFLRKEQNQEKKKEKRNNRLINKIQIHLKQSKTIGNYLKPFIITKPPKITYFQKETNQAGLQEEFGSPSPASLPLMTQIISTS